MFLVLLPGYFLNQAHAWFLEITLVWDVGMCVCLCIHPQAMKNHSHEMKPE